MYSENNLNTVCSSFPTLVCSQPNVGEPRKSESQCLCLFRLLNYSIPSQQVHTSSKACVAVYPSCLQNGILWFWPNSDPQFKNIHSSKKPHFIPELDDPSYSTMIISREIGYGYANNTLYHLYRIFHDTISASDYHALLYSLNPAVDIYP